LCTISAEEPYIYTKETYVSTKEPYVYSKHSYCDEEEDLGAHVDDVVHNIVT